MTTILGIETSCDETAAAVVDDGVRVRSNVIASQVDLHAKYGGVVPEIASRAHIERLDSIIEEAMSVAGVSPDDIDAIAVTNRPGLVGALLIGVTAAKTLSWAWRKPLVAVDHIRAHAYSPAICYDPSRGLQPARTRETGNDSDADPPQSSLGKGGGNRESTLGNQQSAIDNRQVCGRPSPSSSPVAIHRYSESIRRLRSRSSVPPPTTPPAKPLTKSHPSSVSAIPAVRSLNGPRGTATPRRSTSPEPCSSPTRSIFPSPA